MGWSAIEEEEEVLWTKHFVTIIVLWEKMPCSLIEAYWRFGGTSVNIYQTTRRHIQEKTNLDSDRRENLTSLKTPCSYVNILSLESSQT
jgi:hypothetical protein